MKRFVPIALICSAALFGFTAAANAADIYNQGSTKDGPADYGSPGPGRAHGWTGFWFAAQFGGVFGQDEVDFSESYEGTGYPNSSGGINIDGLGRRGFFGELQVGYDQQISQRLVLGLFGGLNFSNDEFSVTANNGSESFNVASYDQEWGGVAGLRLGFLKSQDTMFYVAGGYAFGEMSPVQSDIPGVNEFLSGQETDLSGYFAEVGMETRLTNNIYLTVSGRYTDYGSLNLFDESNEVLKRGAVIGVESASLDMDPHTLAVMVGLKAKLGGGEVFGY